MIINFKKRETYVFKTNRCLMAQKRKKGSYLTGNLDLGVMGQVNVAVFQNEKGEGDEKKPDASIYLFEEEKSWE